MSVICYRFLLFNITVFIFSCQRVSLISYKSFTVSVLNNPDSFSFFRAVLNFSYLIVSRHLLLTVFLFNKTVSILSNQRVLLICYFFISVSTYPNLISFFVFFIHSYKYMNPNIYHNLCARVAL